MKNKNKMMMASLLTLTAGLAEQALVPQYAMAESIQQVGKISNQKFFKLKNQVRYTSPEGQVSLGHIYLDIVADQQKVSSPNQITGEFFGGLKFHSDTKDKTAGHGVKVNTTAAVLGDDGDVMLDLIDDSTHFKAYQIYGCNSTGQVCSSENAIIQVENNSQYTMTINVDADSGLEFLTTNEVTQPDGSVIQEVKWTHKLEMAPLTEMK